MVGMNFSPIYCFLAFNACYLFDNAIKLIASTILRKIKLMSYGSEKTEKIKTKRITSLPITNKVKKLRLAQHFDSIKEHKNLISKYIYSQRHFLLTAENIKILKSHSKNFKIDELSAWEVQTMFHSILDFYKNWLDKLTSNNKFFIQNNYLVTYYKKNVTSRAGHILHKKGDFKSKELIEKSTNMTQLMNWMIYVDEDQLDSVFKKIPENVLQQKAVISFNERLNTLRQGKYWDRIKSLILNKRKRLLSKMKTPMEFSTGSYSKIPLLNKTTQHSYLDHNKDMKLYQHWYNFRLGKNVVKIPLAYNESFHGKSDLSDFNIEKIHTVKLNSKGNINIGLTYNDKNEYFKPLDKSDQIDGKKVCGIDLNVSSNFCTIAFHDKEVAIDYDRSYVQKVVEQLLDYEKTGYNLKSEKKNKDLQKLLSGVEFHFKALISKTLANLQSQGITDIVLEDLNLTQCKASFIKDEVLNIKYSKLIRLLRLSSIKTWFQEQANNRGIRVHLTNAAYTSQECSVCHHIDKNNRSGRLFECVNCGHKQDADANASRVIYSRFFVDVLRESLHKLVEGQYVPQPIKKENLRLKLTSFYEVDNECQRLNKFSGSETSPFRAG